MKASKPIYMEYTFDLLVTSNDLHRPLMTSTLKIAKL